MGDELRIGNEGYLQGKVTGVNHNGVTEIELWRAGGEKEYLETGENDAPDGNILMPKDNIGVGSVCYVKGIVADIRGDVAVMSVKLAGQSIEIEAGAGTVADLDFVSYNLLASEVVYRGDVYTLGDFAETLEDGFEDRLGNLKLHGDLLSTPKGVKLAENAADNFVFSMRKGYLAERIPEVMQDSCGDALEDAEKAQKKAKSGPKS